MMTPDHTGMYRELMTEVWRRTDFIGKLLNVPQLGIYNVTRIESVCLQFRMILENIAFACLVANGEHLDSLPKRIEKAYQADVILKRLDTIVPECYPQPLILVRSEPNTEIRGMEIDPDQYRGEWVEPPPNEWLSRGEFKEVYGRLGNVLHARNPLGRSPDIAFYEKMSPLWLNKIICLLTHHKISIRNDQWIYIAQIPPSGEVTITPFQRMTNV